MNEENTVEVSLEEAKKLVAKKDALVKLCRNQEFVSIILEGYFEKEAARLVMAKAEPALQTEEFQKQIDADILSIGRLDQYFRAITIQGNMAEKSVLDNEEYLEELRKGDS